MLVVDEIQPRFNAIVTTCDHYEEDIIKGGVIVKPKGELKDHQTIIAVGDVVKGLKPGDLVRINLDRYQIRNFKEDNSVKSDMGKMKSVVHYDVPTVKLSGKEYFFLYDNDVAYVVTKSHEEENETIVIPKTKIIV